KGAAVIVGERPVEVPSHVTYLQVENGRVALAELSAAYFGYPAEQLTVVGITGTKGKTTTSNMVKKILEAAGEKAGVIGTNGAFIGQEKYPTVNTTPESYELQKMFRRMVDVGCKYAVMEVSSQGIMMHRVAGFSFDYGMFTNISPDHIGPDEHKDFEEYLEYKSQLLRRCKVCVVNRDDEHYDQIVEKATCQVVTYGLEHKADWTTDRVDYLTKNGFMGIALHLQGPAVDEVDGAKRQQFDVEVGIPGLFNVYNAMAATVLCEQMGIDRAAVCEALKTIRVDGRMEIVHASEKFVALVDYAHNAVSMESLLTTLRDYNPKRLVCIFGCGGNRSKDRRYSMGEIGGRMADLSIITADNSRWEKIEDIMADIRIGMDKTDGAFVEIPDRRDAIYYSIEHAREGDIIAVIGKGHEDYQEICGVRTHFLDREELEGALEKFGYR
ncbi:MAG: UDP-N-acetylmuramoyl-L-alanyl-D-glutamate--2,6-diaminopimelate ligase, partial [Lachnospiraceae bacterium]|nr:UDP-N-acetylmuramoyl-L-alanyl-D-glutamate--2,6-diaminopimelate ligase [Lachnospiraceae bacterium]